MCRQHIRALFSSVCFQTWVPIKKDMLTFFRTCTSLSSQFWMLLKDPVEGSVLNYWNVGVQISLNPLALCYKSNTLLKLQQIQPVIESTVVRYLVCWGVWLFKPINPKWPARLMRINKARKPRLLWVTRPSRDKQNYKSNSLGVLILNVWVIKEQSKSLNAVTEKENVPLIVQCFLQPGVITTFYTSYSYSDFSPETANVKWLRTKCTYCTTHPPLTGPSEGAK